MVRGTYSTVLVLLVVIASITSDTRASNSFADKLIAKHVRALGGYKKIKAIHSLRMDGTYHEGSNTFGTYIEWKRPFYRVVVVGVPEEVYREGFNGTSWEYAAPTGALKITPASSAAGKAARRGAEFNESIIDYRQKGHHVNFIGKEKLNESVVYHLRVTLHDGWVKDYYLDANTYLIVALRKAMPLHATGPAIESLTMYRDYKPVAGVLYPHSFVERNTVTGQVMNTLDWKTIQANVALDNSVFSPPVAKTKK